MKVILIASAVVIVSAACVVGVAVHLLLQM